MGQGKCRGEDRYSYNRRHVYNLKNLLNQGIRVTTEQGCADYCENDDECAGFQFYQNDPGAIDNCNIWTSEGYSGNGSSTSKCYMKVETVEATNNMTDAEKCSTLDPDCIECRADQLIGGCLKCSAGHYILAGVCYKTNGIWG